jgi:hypothetical protein
MTGRRPRRRVVPRRGEAVKIVHVRVRRRIRGVAYGARSLVSALGRITCSQLASRLSCFTSRRATRHDRVVCRLIILLGRQLDAVIRHVAHEKR